MPTYRERSLEWCMACRRELFLQSPRRAAASRLALTSARCPGTRKYSSHARSPSFRFASRVERPKSSGAYTGAGSRRHYLKESSSSWTGDIGVVGGGITGLTTAYYAATAWPQAKVTLYEAADRLGGWMLSQKVDVGDGEIILESGPRTLRPQAPNGALTLKLIAQLNLEDQLLITPKTSPAAKNRFIYYPDHLVRMPGPGQGILEILSTLWNEPVFSELFRGIWKDMSTETRSSDTQDESVGDFIARRLGKPAADNLVSALFHGIYAGDIWKLSAKSIMPLQWENERKSGDLMSAVLTSVVQRTSWNFCDDIALQMKIAQHGWSEKMKSDIRNCSVFSFKDGLSTLSNRLAEQLRSMPNVTIRTGFRVTGISKSQPSGQGDTVTLSGSANGQEAEETHPHNHIIHTINPQHLESSLYPTPPTLPGVVRQSTYAPTVAVTNLYYRTPSLLRTLQPPGGLPRGLQESGLSGFGYLLPQSLPFEQNPERALGVIFDDDGVPDIWSSVPAATRGTRLTVMFGGHWWDGWAAVPSADECAQMARSLLARHLGITEAPAVARTTIQERCIPQYTVGHSRRMAALHDDVAREFRGRVKVAGSWYTGVGVNDCVRAAYDVVDGLDQADWRERTGLERFKKGRPLVMVRRGRGALEVVQVERKGAEMGFFRGVKVEGDGDHTR